ncbi:hypothetical protein RHSIM_Rhsim05G0110500 [Rhododendron simsii]|uniref:CCHC-type domain-containing protein n=1 Tax=Rhododendron simsii TaxID=118357 RepID=A0A834GXE0_RHOSS|nr:hypothetical protein RHSIM_Rhsim05G0110500 [Rhododendron simsii]
MANGNDSGSTTLPTEDNNGRLIRLEGMMANLTGVIQNLQQQMLQTTPPPPPPPAGIEIPPPPPPMIPIQGGEPNVKEFLKLKPPTFIGGMDAKIVKSWISALEKIFKVMRRTDQQKVALAVYQLQGKAEHWWEIIEPQNQGINWRQFLALFKGKYLPQSIQDAKSKEFQQLRQRGFMTVTTYEAEFTNLAEYAPHMVADENKKARKFEDGLKYEIRKVVRPMRLPTYADVVDRALLVEQEIEESKRFTKNRKRQNSSIGNKNEGGAYKRPYTGPTNNGRHGRDQRERVPRCQTCGKEHFRICRSTTTCYGCGGQGHYKGECPNLPSGANTMLSKTATVGKPNTRVQGRAFALVPGDPRNNENVVAGNMLLCSLPAYVLIDSGSSHSFVSLKFSMKLLTQPEPLGFELLVSQPMSSSTICTTVHRDCDLRFGGICFSMDLIPLEMSHFDVILSMDWLSTNHVSIDCANKSVIIKSPDCEFCFKGMGVTSLPYLVSVA